MTSYDIVNAVEVVFLMTVASFVMVWTLNGILACRLNVKKAKLIKQAKEDYYGKNRMD